MDDEARKLAELQSERVFLQNKLALQIEYDAKDEAAVADLNFQLSENSRAAREAGMKDKKKETKDLIDLEKLRIEGMIEGRAKESKEEDKRFQDEIRKYEEYGKQSKEAWKEADEAIALAHDAHRKKLSDIDEKWNIEDRKRLDEINKAIVSEIETIYTDMQNEEKEAFAKGLISYEAYIKEWQRLESLKNTGIKDMKESTGESGGAENADDYIKKIERIRKYFKLEKDPAIDEETGIFDTENYDAQLVQLEAIYNSAENLKFRDYMSTAEYERLKTEIVKKQNKQRQKYTEQALQAASDVLGAFGQLFAVQKENELKLAGDNAQKKEEIERKYARKEQSIKVGQALIAGAMGVMQIVSASATGNAILDAILKPILIAATVLTTGVQIAAIKSQQFAKGRYPVIGADDGQTYQAQWAGEARTGIYNTPSLVAEKGPEMIIDYPTLRNMQMNSPGLVDAIMASRVGQFAQGRYSGIKDFKEVNGSNGINDGGNGLTDAVLARVAIALENNERQMAKLTRWKPTIYTEQVKKDLKELDEIEQNRGL